jgi:SSS family solute:Na+ symporter
MLAALMSSLASLFNSTATLFTVDFYEKLRPSSSEAHLVTVGRIATVIVVLAGLAWIPIMQRIGGGQLYGYLQNVQSLLAPAIAAVFMLGIFSKRVSPISGLVGIVCGFVVGMARLSMQVAHEIGGAEFGALQWFVDINWLYFCFLLFAFTCLLILAVSAFTPKATDEHLEGLTYGTISARQKAELHAGVTTWDVVGSAGVIAIVAAIYLYFW